MRAHHLQIEPEHLAGNGGLGRYVLLPGSADRAARIAGHFDGAEALTNRRRHDVHLGTLPGAEGPVDVAVVATGMGCPSVDIIVTELLQLGARRFLRVGTTGTLQPHVRLGDLVIASGAVRDEATSDVYTPRGYPALADPLLVQALGDAAVAADLGERVHVGIVHTKDSFFGREFALGPDAATNQAYMERLTAAGVVASEMEAAHLFILGAVYGGAPTSVQALRTAAARIRCGAILAVIGTPESGIVPLDEEKATEGRLIDLALAGVSRLASLEGATG